MLGEHHYTLGATWTGNRGTGTSGYRDYDRSITLSVAGKPDLAASADKPFRGDPAKWNPEDLLLAALSQCHALSYLHVCVTRGVVVVAYSDEASATMREDGHGGGAFTEVTLHPRVVIADESMRADALAAHERAGQLCFIARSVNFPVRHEPIIEVAGS